MAARRPAKNPELVLHADDVGVAYVEEVRRALVRAKILLLELEANYVRILVAALDVVDRHRETLALRVLRRNGHEEVGGERGDATSSRQVVAEKRDLSNLGRRFRRFIHRVGSPAG